MVRLVAVTVYGWNALVAERLLMGAWPLLVGYAVLPWLLGRGPPVAGRGPAAPHAAGAGPARLPECQRGVGHRVAVLAGAAGKGRTAKAALLVAAGNAPWLVAGLLHASSATSDAAAAEVFALRGEGSVPAPLAALTLGGIWNTDVQPGSRTGALGWVALVALVGPGRHRRAGLVAAYAGRRRTALLVCWVVGWGLAVLTWPAPGAGRLGVRARPRRGRRPRRRPGARPLRARCWRCWSRKACGCSPTRAPRARVARVALAVGAVLLPVALLPGPGPGRRAPDRAGRLPGVVRRGAASSLEDRDGDVLVLPLSSYRAPVWNHRHLVLDPVGRYLTPRLRGQRRARRRRGAAVGGGPAGPRRSAGAGRADPRGAGRGAGRIGIGAVVTDPTAPGDPPPEVAGESLLDDPDLVVTALERVDVRTSRPAGGSRWRSPGCASWRRGQWRCWAPSACPDEAAAEPAIAAARSDWRVGLLGADRYAPVKPGRGLLVGAIFSTVAAMVVGGRSRRSRSSASSTRRRNRRSTSPASVNAPAFDYGSNN